MRLRLGVLCMAIALSLTVVVIEVEAARFWRALLFIPYGLAAYGVFQGLYRTCPGAAARGVRETAGKDERIANPEELDASRCLARKVGAGSVAFAVIATALVWVVP